MVSIGSYVYVYWCKTAVRTVYGNSNDFEVKVGMHQGSALSPLLFVIVMDTLSREFRVAIPCQFLYADDLFVIPETKDNLIKRLNEWKDRVENRGRKINVNKTKGNAEGCKMTMWFLWKRCLW